MAARYIRRVMDQHSDCRHLIDKNGNEVRDQQLVMLNGYYIAKVSAAADFLEIEGWSPELAIHSVEVIDENSTDPNGF